MMGFAPGFGVDPTPLAPPASQQPGTPAPAEPASAAPAGQKVPLKTMLGFAPGAMPVAPPAASTAPSPASAAPQQPASPPAAAAPKPAFAGTMLGVAFPPPGEAALPPSAAPAPAGMPKGTMLGVALPGIAPLSASQAPDPPAAAPAPASAVPKGTMLGVALPGIAPLSASQPASPPSAAPAPSAMPKGTMLGVAIPGIAPLSASQSPRPAAAPAHDGPAQAPVRKGPALASTVALVAAPAPLEEMAAPSAPRIVKSGGVSLVAVASILGGLVLVGGVATALLWRQPPPISAQPKASPDGKDVLHLTCDPASCKDGTTATLGAVKATFAGGQADLALAEPLHVGDNDLVLQIARPGLGRDEAVKMRVPVAFRVHADIATMTGVHPSITVRAEALPGSDVRVDGKPVVLDANGTGSYAIDETAATEGPADESKAIAVDVPYVVVPKGGTAQNGTVSARLSVAPLRVDAPGTRGVFEEDHVLVAGRAAKGASVTVDGAPVAVGADGSFETTVLVPNLGDRTIDVRGGTAALTPRTVHVALHRVKSLAGEAKAFEAEQTIAYATAMANVAAATGHPIVLEGEIFESRGSGHRTLVLLDNRRGCSGGACMVKVVIGHDVKLTRGEIWRVYGTVTGGSPNAAGQTTLEVTADFVLKSKK